MRAHVSLLHPARFAHRIRREQIIFDGSEFLPRLLFIDDTINPVVLANLSQTITETTTGPIIKKKFAEGLGGRKQQAESTISKIDIQSIQSRLVLLTLAFPRLRIIWSSSPHVTAGIFAELKGNHHEPDEEHAATIGTDSGEPGDGKVGGGGENAAAEDVLRSLPGIGTKKYRYVMGRINSVRELCEMDLESVKELLGAEPGQQCYNFLHRGLKNRWNVGWWTINGPMYWIFLYSIAIFAYTTNEDRYDIPSVDSKCKNRKINKCSLPALRFKTIYECNDAECLNKWMLWTSFNKQAIPLPSIRTNFAFDRWYRRRCSAQRPQDKTFLGGTTNPTSIRRISVKYAKVIRKSVKSPWQEARTRLLLAFHLFPPPMSQRFRRHLGLYRPRLKSLERKVDWRVRCPRHAVIVESEEMRRILSRHLIVSVWQ